MQDADVGRIAHRRVGRPDSALEAIAHLGQRVERGFDPVVRCVTRKGWGQNLIYNHTLDKRFQVNWQSIGSYYSIRRPITVARDTYRWVLFVAYRGRQWVSIGIFKDLLFVQ